MPDEPAPPQRPVAQTVDPKSILFSLPTLSDDLPELEQVQGRPEPGALILHEDDWSQLEFFSPDRLAEVEQMLRAYKPFEAANRVGAGWKKPFVRKIARQPVVRGSRIPDRLASLVGAQVALAPILMSAPSVGGRVKNGFSIPLGGNVTLYGYEDDAGIAVLGASLGRDPVDHKLTEAFARLNAAEGLILVDWRQQLVLTAIEADGNIRVWQP
ncbi:hypothetical protein EV701_10544 [Chthoniobacter flavus]|nr:hypothetical protein EV701_10544 [Chthoniobacter flavus]